jgi:hypothetical protein
MSYLLTALASAVGTAAVVVSTAYGLGGRNEARRIAAMFRTPGKPPEHAEEHS